MVLLWNDGHLTPARVEQLRRSFPLAEVVTGPMETLQKEKSAACQEVGVIYAKELSIKQLEVFVNVKWMHCPLTFLKEPLHILLRKKQDLLLTYLVKEPTTIYLDFATSLLLACSQGLLEQREYREAKLKPFSHTLLLQVGLGAYGSALAKRAKEAHMHVIGIAETASFHPFCDKVLRHEQLHSVLPAADIVIVTAGRSDEKNIPICQEELALMKPGSCLFVLGAQQSVDFTALFAALEEKRFSQVWLDGLWEEAPAARQKDDKELMHFLHTPGLIDTLEVDLDSDFRFFLWNLDCFFHRRYVEMKGLWDRAPARLLERRGARER